jgi:hypothetical protein
MPSGISLRRIALTALLVLVSPFVVESATNIADVSATSTIPEALLNARNLTLDVFTFPVPPTRLPDVRGATPVYSTKISNGVDLTGLPLDGLGGSNIAQVNCAGRVRGRLRPTQSGTFAFVLITNKGGAMMIDGGVVASSDNLKNVTGRLYLDANKDVNIEAFAYNGATETTFRMALYWALPGRLQEVELVPSEMFYAPLDEYDCKIKCKTKPCRMNGGKAECFEFTSTSSGSADVVDLESLFPAT